MDTENPDIDLTLAAVPAQRTGTLRDEFAAFYRSSMPRLVGFLVIQGAPLQDAADVAQETMAQAYRRWAQVSHPQAWTRRVASRLWARRLAHVGEDPVSDIPESVMLPGDTDVVAWEQRHHLLHVLDRLPSRQRQVLAWTLDGYTPAEIAAELQLNPEAVRATLYKARRTVARQLASADDD